MIRVLTADQVTTFVEGTSYMATLLNTKLQLYSEASITKSTAGSSSASTSRKPNIGKQRCVFVGIRLMSLRSFKKFIGVS